MKRKKRHIERRFKVHATLGNLELTRTGSALKLVIESKGVKLGELEIGRGSLFWWGAHRAKRKRLRWSRFADMLNHLAYSRG